MRLLHQFFTNFFSKLLSRDEFQWLFVKTCKIHKGPEKTMIQNCPQTMPPAWNGCQIDVNEKRK